MNIAGAALGGVAEHQIHKTKHRRIVGPDGIVQIGLHRFFASVGLNRRQIVFGLHQIPKLLHLQVRPLIDILNRPPNSAFGSDPRANRAFELDGHRIHRHHIERIGHCNNRLVAAPADGNQPKPFGDIFRHLPGDLFINHR